MEINQLSKNDYENWNLWNSAKYSLDSEMYFSVYDIKKLILLLQSDFEMNRSHEISDIDDFIDFDIIIRDKISKILKKRFGMI